MKRTIATAYLLAGLLAAGCSNAQFAGQTGRSAKTGADPQPATSTPVVAAPLPAGPTPTPTPLPAAPAPVTPGGSAGVPAACQNTISSTGVHDNATGLTFKLLPQPLGYDDAVAQCATAGQSGLLIAAGQDLPDAVLACKAALGTLWLRPGATLDLWQPNVTGTDDPKTPHWIICYFK